MKEVEVKYCVNNFKSVKSKLRKLGFKEVKDEEYTDFYYTDKALKFIKNETCLRLRRKGSKALLTYKPRTVRRDTIKSKSEVETLVEFKDMDRIIRGLGFKLAVSFAKKSEEYKKGFTSVHLDTINGKTYVEVEVMRSNVKKAKEEISDLSSELGLKKIELRNYRDIMLGFKRLPLL